MPTVCSPSTRVLPPRRRSPSFFGTGTLSPVKIASSVAPQPRSTRPSHATRSPSRTFYIHFGKNKLMTMKEIALLHFSQFDCHAKWCSSLQKKYPYLFLIACSSFFLFLFLFLFLSLSLYALRHARIHFLQHHIPMCLPKCDHRCGWHA